MKRYAYLLIALPMIGQAAAQQPQQQQQLARCVFGAESDYPDSVWPAGDRQTYVWLCMAAHGYKLSRMKNGCMGSVSGADAVLYAQCYEPNAPASPLPDSMATRLGE
ncbi:MAG TPA: hypothetical protein VMH84_07650 [Xanthobacteraceae bacterium]|nr:hypothetical protein [Xanthobacteraceae bacterium]